MAIFNYAKRQILIAPNDNMSMGYILIIKIRISCKLHMNGLQMKSYMLIVYIIHVECVNIKMNYILWLNSRCDFN
jgi:hypothetical protein